MNPVNEGPKKIEPERLKAIRHESPETLDGSSIVSEFRYCRCEIKPGLPLWPRES